jgi:hypothetical protein
VRFENRIFFRTGYCVLRTEYFFMTLALLSLWLCLPTQAPASSSRPFERVHRGMAPEEVRHLLGAPQHVVRQLLFGRYVEQWIYPPPGAGRVEFLAERTGPPAVRAVHPANRAGL